MNSSVNADASTESTESTENPRNNDLSPLYIECQAASGQVLHGEAPTAINTRVFDPFPQSVFETPCYQAETGFSAFEEASSSSSEQIRDKVSSAVKNDTSPLAVLRKTALDDDVISVDCVEQGPSLPPGSLEIPNYYPPSTFPALESLRQNAHKILAEVLHVDKWHPWPEDLFDMRYGDGHEWTIFPFLHTFPALDTARMTWIESTNALCPSTSALLKAIPDIRTALVSRLGPKTDLMPHTGWRELSNYVLRCHVSLHIPDDGENLCGLNVCREVRYQEQGGVIIFDDSKLHKAFNRGVNDRYVLIVDILRPEHVPPGIATGVTTPQLENLINLFK